MIPYKDDNPTEIFPFVTIGLIALNVAVFFVQIFSPAGQREVVYAYGAVPHNLLSLGGGGGGGQPIHPWATVFTSMFMHAGFLHLGGNMLYLWIFGNNIEEKLGRCRFILFYIVGGIVAAFAHTLAEPMSEVPMVGASGAVSAVLGAYLLLFPRAGVYVIVILVFFIQVIKVPALIVIGFWAIIQLLNGFAGGAAPGQGGVAWFAHIGGFVYGVATVKLFMLKRGRLKKWL